MTTIRSYADARKHFDATKPWRGSVEVPLTKRTYRNKFLREEPDGSIICHYQMDLITYHPDGDVTLHGVQWQINSFYPSFLPTGIWMITPTHRVGAVTLLAPVSQKVERSWGPNWYGFPFNIRRDPSKELDWNNRKLNPDVKVFRNDQSVRLRFDQVRDMWWPVDEAALKPFEWNELDKSKSRKISAGAGFAAFNNWFNAYSTLKDDDQELPPFEGSIDDDEMIALLRAEDMVTALKHFPRSQRYNWNRGGYYEHGIEGGYINRLRNLLYKREGTTVPRSERIITLPEYHRVKGLLYRFGGVEK
jgi:hypothetical protein